MPSESENREHGIPLLDVEAQKADGDYASKGDDDGMASHESEQRGPPPPASSTTVHTSGAGRKFLFWTAINMMATIGIVFTNKAIFNDPDFKLMQTSFASFHFVCTGLTLWVVSRPRIGAFVPKRAGIVEMLPVSHETDVKTRHSRGS